jgi:hypothetical protein
MNSEIELLPCPFKAPYGEAYCRTLGCSGFSIEANISEWNTRAPRTISAEQLERAAKVQSMNFPVVRTGEDEDGNWCVDPLPFEDFKHTLTLALATLGITVGGS